MALDTYSGLKQSIIDHLDRDDLTGFVDDFIDIAESRHKRDIRIREMILMAPLAITEGDRYVDLPADFAELNYFRILNPDTSVEQRRYLPSITQMNQHELTKISTNCARRARSFAVHEQIEFDAEADQDYDAEVLYYVYVTALSDGDPVNSILTLAPETYLYAALSASAPFLLNDERLTIWETLYGAARDSLNKSSRSSIRSGPQISKVKGAV